MHVALVEDAEHDIHRHQRREDQPGLGLQRGLEGAGGALKAPVDGGRYPDAEYGLFDRPDGVAE